MTRQADRITDKQRLDWFIRFIAGHYGRVIVAAFTSATPDSPEVKEALKVADLDRERVWIGGGWIAKNGLRLLRVLAHALRAAQVKIEELESEERACIDSRLAAALARLAEAEKTIKSFQELPATVETAIAKCGHNKYWTGHFGTCMACQREAVEAKLAAMTKERDKFKTSDYKRACEMAVMLTPDQVRELTATLTAALGNWRELGLSLWAQFASYDFNGGKKYDNMALSALEDLEDALHRAGLLGGAGEPLWENINRALPTPPAAEGENP